MFNVLEASKVKATHQMALASGFVVALALGGAVSPLAAQAVRTISRDPKADAILVEHAIDQHAVASLIRWRRRQRRNVERR